MADNLLTSAALACTAPLVVAPAMNDHMWEHPATRGERRDAAAARRARSSRPATGPLASKGEWGTGRLAEPAEILAAIEQALPRGPSFAPRSLDGLRVLVTAGGTREPIDSVRYVGNRSSGRMGVALAAEAAARGADVTLVAANVALDAPAGVSVVDVSRPPPSSRRPPRGRFAARRRAADGRRRRRLPAGRRRSTTRSRRAGATGWRSSSSPPTDVLAGARRRAPRRARRWSASPPSTARAALERRPRQARAQGPRRRRAQRHLASPAIGFDSEDNEVTIVTAAGEQRGAARLRSTRWRLPSSTRSSELRTAASVIRERTPRGARRASSTTSSSAAASCSRRGDFAAAAIPLEQARALEPDKTSIREALGRAYFRSGRFEDGRRGVRRGRRARPGQRLRPLLPRPRAREDRPPRARRAATPALAAVHAARPRDYRALPGPACARPSRRQASALAAHAPRAPSTTRPSRRSSSRSSTRRHRQVGVDPDLAATAVQREARPSASSGSTTAASTGRAPSGSPSACA